MEGEKEKGREEKKEGWEGKSEGGRKGETERGREGGHTGQFLTLRSSNGSCP